MCIRIRPFSQSEAAQGAFCAWKPIPDYAGHLQQYTPAEEPVPGSTYAFGEEGALQRAPCAAAEGSGLARAAPGSGTCVFACLSQWSTVAPSPPLPPTPD